VAISYPNKGKYKVGDVLRTLFYDKGDECWEHTFYEIIDRKPGTPYAESGTYGLRKVAGDGTTIAMNVKYFDEGVISCYGNTKDGTLDPVLRILYGKS